jgi:pantoate--beta-alanine ligase
MRIFGSSDELRHWSREVRLSSRNSSGLNTVGLVPTMGALHEGHASLIRAAAASCSHIAVSIFVNPTQFGPNEDYARYPRTFEADCALAASAGATAIFAPPVDELYPQGAATFVDVKGLSNRLDGLSRPGHFRGVATVVAKLLIAAEADRAYFGQKDAAQVSVIRRMVTDLRISTEIIVCPIVRDADGLALSSRNAYLNPVERAQALTLSRAIRHVESLTFNGERRPCALIAAARSVFECEPSVRIDYIECVNWSTLEPADVAAPGTLFAVAAHVGATRLIDNAILP